MNYKVVVFDLDGTLIDGTESVWKTIHEYFGLDEHPERIEAKKKFFNGEITYQEWAERDIELLKKHGADKQKLMKAISKLKLMNGALETLKELKKRGYKLAIISGSLNIVLEKFLPGYDKIFDYVFINRILFDKNGNIKSIESTRFDVNEKVGAMKIICEKEGITSKECVFVGDHDNDIYIAKECGFSIAFNPNSEKLRDIADVVIEKKDVREILKYL